MTAPLARRLLAEAVGTALLVAVVVGSGIAARRLSPGDTGLQLLENSITTALGLAVLILVFGPVSGAHLNPAVSAASWLLGRRSGTGLSGRDVLAYGLAQACWRWSSPSSGAGAPPSRQEPSAPTSGRPTGSPPPRPSPTRP